MIKLKHRYFLLEIFNPKGSWMIAVVKLAFSWPSASVWSVLVAVASCVYAHKENTQPYFAKPFSAPWQDDFNIAAFPEKERLEATQLTISSLSLNEHFLGQYPVVSLVIEGAQKGDFFIYEICQQNDNTAKACEHGRSVSGNKLLSSLPSGRLQIKAQCCQRSLEGSRDEMVCGPQAEGSFFRQAEASPSPLQHLLTQRFQLMNKLANLAFPLRERFVSFKESPYFQAIASQHGNFAILVENHLRMGPDLIGAIIASKKYDELLLYGKKALELDQDLALQLTANGFRSHRKAGGEENNEQDSDEDSPSLEGGPLISNGSTIMWLTSVEIGVALGLLSAGVTADVIGREEGKAIRKIKRKFDYRNIKINKQLLEHRLINDQSLKTKIEQDYKAMKAELAHHKPRLHKAESVARWSGILGSVLGIGGLIIALLETNPAALVEGQGGSLTAAEFLGELKKFEEKIAGIKAQLARVEAKINEKVGLVD